MRIIEATALIEPIARLCMEAGCVLPADVAATLERLHGEEPWPVAKDILGKIIENYNLAKEKNMPICQDTGVACVFLDIGRDVHIEGDLYEAVNAGVARGYKEGYFRNSVVQDPLNRKNTGNNTPAMVYIDIVEGDKITINLAPKGFGSENMSRLAMLKPSDGVEGVVSFVLETVRLAGPNPCPPIMLGIGIGGTFDKAALIAKKALLRPMGAKNPDPYYADLEARILREVNALGVGPQGFGGKTTAFAVAINTLPTHIAGLPVAVNINCHAARHTSEVI